MRASVFGLGKLGFPLAALLAAKGFRVIGVDLNPAAVAAANGGPLHIVEPGVEALLAAGRQNLMGTSNGEYAVAESDVSFVIVPTPSEDDGRFSLRYVRAAGEVIARGLAAKESYHLVVLTSTVMPGDTEGQLKPFLEARSGKRAGRDFGLCYSPEFIALGSVVRDMLRPDFMLIGEGDARAGMTLAGIYARVIENKPPIARMNFVNAELAKLSVNTFVTTRISYANMLAQVCERLPGADVATVTDAIGLDSRIGRKYLKGAVSYGGPCFPRDNIAFSHLARMLGVEPILAEATHAMNLRQTEHLAGIALAHLPVKGALGILGLSYKPGTPEIEASASVDLARRTAAKGHRVIVFDPQAMPAARPALAGKADFADSLVDCARAADVLVIAVPWPEFAALKPADLKPGPRTTVIDCWRMLAAEDFATACTLVILGRGVAPAAQSAGGRAAAG